MPISPYKPCNPSLGIAPNSNYHPPKPPSGPLGQTSIPSTNSANNRALVCCRLASAGAPAADARPGPLISAARDEERMAAAAGAARGEGAAAGAGLDLRRPRHRAERKKSFKLAALSAPRAWKKRCAVRIYIGIHRRRNCGGGGGHCIYISLFLFVCFPPRAAGWSCGFCLVRGWARLRRGSNFGRRDYRPREQPSCELAVTDGSASAAIARVRWWHAALEFSLTLSISKIGWFVFWCARAWIRCWRMLAVKRNCRSSLLWLSLLLPFIVSRRRLKDIGKRPWHNEWFSCPMGGNDQWNLRGIVLRGWKDVN